MRRGRIHNYSKETMTTNANNGSNKPGSSSKQLLTGNTVLDKLLNQLSKDDRELVLRLMTELGIKADDPTHPLLVAMQYYVSILRDIPDEMKAAAEESLRRAITVYGGIQTQIDNSATRIEGKVSKIDDIRVQWNQDTAALLPKFKTAFDEAMQVAVAAYKAKTSEIAENSLQEWATNLEHVKTMYLRDVLKQGLIWASGVSAIALLAVGGAAYWFGVQQGKANAVEEFGNQDWYTISQQMINRADNKQRLINCYNDSNPKCTVWIQDPQ